MSIKINTNRDELVSLLVSGNPESKPGEARPLGSRYRRAAAIPLIIIVSVLIALAWFTTSIGEDPGSVSEHDTANGVFREQVSPLTDSPAGTTTADDVVLNAAGFVVARRLATASSEVTGMLTSVDVDEGMHLQKGDILATIDSSVLKEDIRLAAYEKNFAALQYERLEAELEELAKQHHRLRELLKNGFVAIRDVDEITLKQQTLKLNLQAAEVQKNIAAARMDRLAQELKKYTIRAPFSGVVIGKSAQAGEIVSPSSAGGGFTRTGICTIVDMSSLEIEVDVNERYLQKIAVDQPVVANLDAYPEWNINGSVIAIIPVANRSKGTVRVRVKILEDDRRIVPDMSLRVSFGKKVN